MKQNYKHKLSILISFAILLILIGCSDSSDKNNLPEGELLTILTETVAGSTVPGAIMGIRTPADTWFGAAGKADTSTCKLMTPDMQVRLASITKPLTAVLTMKLVEEGVLSLDDTVEDYLPGKIPQGDEMTLKMLLNHSAGIADATTNISFWEEVYSNPTRDWTHQEILSISTPNTPVFTPGTGYDYSNTGYYLLGMIIEANTGSTVDSLFQEKITQPANLNLTSLSRQGELEEPCTNGYAWLFTTEEVVETKNWNFSWDWTAGAGVSTARDMLDFADELFNGNILESETVELMISPESFAPNASYGLGLGILPAEAPGNIFGTKLIGWSGANPGTATQWYYFPAYETTFFIAINRNDIAEGPGSSPPLNGTAISTDILIQAWEVVKDELDICEGRRIL